MSARIANHREERDDEWTTLEEPIEIAEAISSTPPEA
jgi:adenosyl cobinamide kinase/adenosyl cobinamide phosphate guanylyltransferase